MKSLVQETLWYLNMNKIREDEATMRELVQGVESCMRKVILADHSTAVSAIIIIMVDLHRVNL